MFSDQSVRALLNRSSPPLEVVRFPKRFLTDPRFGCHAAAVVFSSPLGASTSRCTGPEPAGTTEESSSAPGGSPTRTQARRRMRRLPPAGDGLVPERNSLLSCARSSSHAAASEAAARVASRSGARPRSTIQRAFSISSGSYLNGSRITSNPSAILTPPDMVIRCSDCL